MVRLHGMRINGASVYVGGSVGPLPSAFILGTTEPIGNVNVGCGIYAAAPTVTADTRPGVTYNSSTKVFTVAPGTTVADVVFPGFVNLGDGAILQNYLVSGPPAEYPSDRALVSGPATGTAYAHFGTVLPDVPSPYYDGFGPRNLVVTRSFVRNTADGVRAYNTSGGLVNLLIESSRFDESVQFSPDYVNSRAETHNDTLIQFQGTTAAGATVADVILRGCSVDARHSTTKGNIPPYRAQISAVMLSANVGPIHGTIDQCWLRGGVYCVNAGSSSLSGSGLVVTNCQFERPGTDALAPDVALAVDALLAFTGSGNTYIDNGAPVPVTSA